jgi:AcrR family transcriptional regulator
LLRVVHEKPGGAKVGIAERREREKENLRVLIIEAARDLLSEKGLDGLSMRGIADRIEYSPATIYLYFRDKDELVREVVAGGFKRLGEYMVAEIGRLGRGADALEQYRATGRAYARFALENTAYFRVMFELPTVAHMECPAPCADDPVLTEEPAWQRVVALMERAQAEGLVVVADAEQAAVIGWGLVHGLASLYVGGHLRSLQSAEQFYGLVEAAMATIGGGWRGGGAPPAAETALAAGS